MNKSVHFLQALSNHRRWGIIIAIAKFGPMHTRALQDVLGETYPNINWCLGVLRDAGLIVKTKRAVHDLANREKMLQFIYATTSYTGDLYAASPTTRQHHHDWNNDV